MGAEVYKESSTGNKRSLKLFTLPGGKSALTKRERQVWDLFTKEYLEPLNIAFRLKISKRRVFSILKTIKSKGYNADAIHWGSKIDPTSEQYLNKSAENRPSFPVENRCRLHGMHWVVKLLRKTPAYEKLRKQGVQYHQGCCVKLHRETIEVHQNPDIFFWGADENESASKAMAYWFRFFTFLQDRLGVVLLKDRYSNMRLVAQHFAFVNDVGARDAVNRGEKIKVYAEDGKLRFLIDTSLKEGGVSLPEAEAVHPETAQEDAGTYREFIDDLLLKKPLPLSELQGMILETQKMLNGLAQQHAETLRILQTTVQAQAVASQQSQVLVKSLQALLAPQKVAREPRNRERPPYVG